jgi:hypothetical protein
MSITHTKPPVSEGRLSHLIPDETGAVQGVIGWSSLFFAILQSICTFFAALSGLRLIIGVGSLAMSAGVGVTLDRFHADWIRIPMIGLALIGSLLNLFVLMHIRHLRKRPASQWRKVPLSPRRIRMERVQLVLSIATLAFIAIEEYLHFLNDHHL